MVLSIGRISAGDGWRYLTDQVATMDAPRAKEPLYAYYRRTGYPPGMWIGHQAAAFGLAGGVDEQAMAHLFGRLAHPLTGRPLGGRPRHYATLAERVERRIRTLGRPVTDTERAAITAAEAAKPDRRAVAGFDLTFSAPKSVSVLFALAPPELRDQLRAAHNQAWRHAFDMFETDVAATRLGTNGIAQVDVAGVAAAAFEHWYSRSGDPQLHTHVAVSALVATGDGRWRRLDGRAVYHAAAAVSERYEAALIAAVTAMTGLRWDHRPSPRTGIVLSEIAGIPDELLRRFSTRRLAIDTETAKLAADYHARHGHSPDRNTLARLAQVATLAHRPPGQHRRLAHQLQHWADQAAPVLRCAPEHVAGVIVARTAHAGRPLQRLPRRKLAHHAQATIDRLTDTAATWSQWDIIRHATAQLRETNHRADPATIDRLVQAVLAQPDLFPLATNPHTSEVPDLLRRADRASPFVRRGEQRYSSTRIADAEAALVALAAPDDPDPAERQRRRHAPYGQLDEAAIVARLQAGLEQWRNLAARQQKGPAGDTRRAVIDAHLREVRQAVIALKTELVCRHRPHPTRDLKTRLAGLGIDQAAAALRLADPHRRLDALIGPAGSGKTTTLTALVDLWADHGHGAHLLAPTATAARVAGETLGLPYDTIHGALRTWANHHNLLRPGDLVIIDEASMATTPALLAVTQAALSAGAAVRLVGDPHQLHAVGAGGGLALIAETIDAPELCELHRFEHHWEADATLALRAGDPSGLDAYFEHHRIEPNLDHAAVAQVVHNWTNSPAGPAGTIMVASDHHTVRQLNTLARHHRINAGDIAADGVTLHDGTTAGVGDLIVTRRNHRDRPGGPFLVRNRDRWTIEAVHPDGSLTAANADRARQLVTLAADYVAHHVQLGYADTGHGAQGRTVDRAEIVVRPGDTRWYLYVAMSRARHHTTAHVIIEHLNREPLYQPGRTARTVLEGVLANNQPVSLTDWQATTQHANHHPAHLADQYRHTQNEELRHRLHQALQPHHADSILQHPDADQLIHAARAAEDAGHDAAAILTQTATAPDSIAAACHQLDQHRQHCNPDHHPRLHAGVLPAPGAHVAPDIAAWLDTLGSQLTNWRDELASQLANRQPPPPWTHRLGPPPDNPHQRKIWARHVAQIATWRHTQHLTGADLIGPKLPPGHPNGPARARIVLAVQQVRVLTQPAQQPVASNTQRARRLAQPRRLTRTIVGPRPR